MVVLYGGVRSRASIVRWYLEELAVAYEFKVLDMAQEEHRQDSFLSLNPFGKVPTLTDGSFSLFESGAILLYLAEKHGQLPTDPQQRAVIDQWVLFANATLSQGLFIESVRDKETPRLLAPLQKILSQHPFLLGDTFSVVDVAVGSVLAYGPMMVGTSYAEYPAVQAYVERLQSRPAFAKGILGKSE